jgi:cysteine desulfurase
MADRVYLDWNATAPLRPPVRAAMLAAMDLVGNPSSVHAEGRAARALVEDARETVAAFVGAAPGDVVFTSGGSEANALALTPGIGRAGEPGMSRLLVSAIEHPSVLCGGRFPGNVVEQIPVTSQGTVDLSALEMRLASLGPETRALVSVMLANNETGVIQPVAAVAERVHATGGLVHVDAVQAAGKIPFDINSLHADLVSLSGHKLGGPKGVGALVRRADVTLRAPLIGGGGQERRLRAGTENVVAIAGFCAAITESVAAMAGDVRHMLDLRQRLEAGLHAIQSGFVIFAEREERLPNTVLFAQPGLTAETMVIALDLAGMAVSSGSACSSGKVTPSHVLAAMGVGPDLASGAIRVSLGWNSAVTQIDAFLEALRSVVARLNKSSKKESRGCAA